MAALKHVLELVFNPFFLMLVALLASSAWFRKTHQLGALRYCLLVIGLALIVCSTGWLPGYLTQKLESYYPVVREVNPQVHWIVVLGGGHAERADEPPNDLLTGASLKRLIEGVRLARLLPKAQVVLSGGGDTKNLSEAVLMQRVSQWFFLPEEQIVLEAQAMNTQEQAHALAKIVHKEPFYLVTSAIHMPRSMRLCQQQGLNPIAAPTDFTLFYQEDPLRVIIPNAYNLYYMNIALHELMGMTWSAFLNNLTSRPA